MSVSPINYSLPTHAQQLSIKPREYFQSRLYKLTKETQNNNIFNRAMLEFLGIDIPSALTELIGRNWKVALESVFRDVFFLITTYFMPLIFLPILNKISSKKHGLPVHFKKLFYNQFEDLLPEKNNEKDNELFRQKLVKLEGEEEVKKYFGQDKEKSNDRIKEFKEKLLRAKTYVMRWDIQILGLVMYLIPWAQVLFSKKVLGVSSFAGELDYLSKSQQEESARFHEKTKHFKFALGFISTIFGSNWYSNKVYRASTANNTEVSKSKLLSFIKKNIRQFDYYKQIYANRLNIAGAWVFGGDFGYILTVRSLNEFIERFIKLIMIWPTILVGLEWLYSKFASWNDKKYGTQLIDHEAPKEIGVTKVKTLDKLEAELNEAEREKDDKKKEKIFSSIKAQNKFYWLSLLIDSLIMGVGLSVVNIFGTKKRVERGIY